MLRCWLMAMTALSLLCACPDEKPAAPPPAPPAENAAPAQPAAPQHPKGITPVTVRPSQDPHDDHGPPDFVKRGSGVFDDGGKRWFYGAGKAKGLDNMMRAHMLADRAANAELLNQLRLYNQKAIDVLGVEIRTRADNYAAAQVEKAEIVDHWIDHDNGEWHSLRRVDAKAYAEGLFEALEASEEVRQKIGMP